MALEDFTNCGRETKGTPVFSRNKNGEPDFEPVIVRQCSSETFYEDMDRAFAESGYYERMAREDYEAVSSLGSVFAQM